MATPASEMLPLVITGAGGHAVSVANVAYSTGRAIRCFVDPARSGQTLLDIPVVGELTELGDVHCFSHAIAIGDNAVRERVYSSLLRRHPGLTFPVLIHRSAVISMATTIQEGTVVMPNAVVGPNSKVGRFCILNTMSSVDHDCQMHDFSSLAPGAVAGGAACIGQRSAISIGATLKHAVTVGADTVIGANSYVNSNLGNNLVAFGCPARVIRQRNSGDPYLR